MLQKKIKSLFFLNPFSISPKESFKEKMMLPLPLSFRWIAKNNSKKKK